MNNKIYVVVCISCKACGGEVRVASFEDKPSEEDVQLVADSMGGMNCIKTVVKFCEVKKNGKGL